MEDREITFLREVLGIKELEERVEKLEGGPVEALEAEAFEPEANFGDELGGE